MVKRVKDNTNLKAAERLQEIRDMSSLNQKQFAELFGVNITTYNRYESGEIGSMPLPLIEKICKQYSINPSWLLGIDDNEKYMDFDKVFKPKKRIPVLGTIAAGQPILATEEILDYEHVYTDSGIDFCLRVKGDSMMNARIFDGDIVFVHQQPDVENGEIAVVMIDGEEATLKRVYKNNGTVILHPENPKYQDMVIAKKDFKQVQILGKVKSVKFDVE